MRLERLFEVIEDEGGALLPERIAMKDRRNALCELISVTPKEQWPSLTEVALNYLKDAQAMTEKYIEYLKTHEVDNIKRIDQCETLLEKQILAKKYLEQGKYDNVFTFDERSHQEVADHFIKKYGKKDQA